MLIDCVWERFNEKISACSKQRENTAETPLKHSKHWRNAVPTPETPPNQEQGSSGARRGRRPGEEGREAGLPPADVRDGRAERGRGLGLR